MAEFSCVTLKLFTFIWNGWMNPWTKSLKVWKISLNVNTGGNRKSFISWNYLTRVVSSPPHNFCSINYLTGCQWAWLNPRLARLRRNICWSVDAGRRRSAAGYPCWMQVPQMTCSISGVVLPFLEFLVIKMENQGEIFAWHWAEGGGLERRGTQEFVYYIMIT